MLILLSGVAVLTWHLKHYWIRSLQHLKHHTISRARFERITKRNKELVYLRDLVNGTTILSVIMWSLGTTFSLVTASCAVVSCAALIKRTVKL